MNVQKPHWHCVVSLHRGGHPLEGEAWPVNVQERLPRIWVPLEKGVPDRVLDLQALFDRNYDAGNYARHIDCTQDPVPPLEGEDAAWMDALLREKGLRE